MALQPTRKTLASRPLIPWMGGKSRLAKHILPLFPEHSCYVEVFAGAAAVFFRKDPVKSEVLNDINGELVNLYRVVRFHMEEFVHQFHFALASRQMFEWLKITRPETLTDIQRAARFFYLQRLCFGGKAYGHTFGTSTTAPPKLRLRDLEQEMEIAWQRLADATVENLDWLACLEKYDRPHTLAYLDPPYLDTEGYGTGTFGLEEWEAIGEATRSMKGKAVISSGDHPEIRRIFKGCRIEEASITYTVGGPSSRPRRKELVICAW